MKTRVTRTRASATAALTAAVALVVLLAGCGGETASGPSNGTEAVATVEATTTEETTTEEATTTEETTTEETTTEETTEETTTEETTTEETTTAETATTETVSEPPREAPITRIVVRDGQPVGGIARIDVRSGERVRFVVRSDIADEVHVHGFDIKQDVKANGSVRFDFLADIEGVFDVELEDARITIARVRVNP